MRAVSIAVLFALAFCVMAQKPAFAPLWSLQLPFPVNPNPASGITSTMYFVDDVNGTVYGVNTSTHKVQWSLRWDDLTSFLAFEESDTLILQLQEGTWAVSAATGKLKWVNNTYQFSSVSQSKDVLLGVLVNSAGVNVVSAFDAPTGVPLWTIQSAMVPDVIGNIGIYQSTDALNNNWIVACNLRTGAVIWKRAIQQYVGSGNNVVIGLNTSATTFTQDLVFLDPMTGAIRGRVNNATSSSNLKAFFAKDDTAIMTDSVSFIAAFNCSAVRGLWMTDLSNIQPLANGVQNVFVDRDSIIAQSNLNFSSHVQLFNLTAFRFRDGAQKWTIVQPPTTAATTNPIDIFSGIVYVPNIVGYTAWSEETGKLVYNTFSEQLPFQPGTTQEFGRTIYSTSPTGLVGAYSMP